MNIAKMLTAATQAKKRMSQLQDELSKHLIETSAGNNQVTVSANAAGEILSIKISNNFIEDTDEREMLEDILLTAIRQANNEAKSIAAKEMSKLTSELGLPDLPNFNFDGLNPG